MFIGQILLQLAKVGNVLLRKHASELSKVIEPVLEEVLPETLTLALDPSNGRGEQAKRIFEALGTFNESLNGQAIEGEHPFLQDIIDGKIPMNKDTLKKVLDIADRLKKLEVYDQNGQGLLFDVEPRTKQDEQIKPSVEKPKAEGAEGADRDAEIKKLKEELAEKEKLEAENIQLKEQAKGGRAYQVSEEKDDSDVEVLAKAAKNALELELTRGGSWISLGWRFGLIKLEGVTSEEQIPAYLAKNLINPDFTKKVREFLNTNQFNTDGLEKPQKLAMHCLKWTTRFGRFLSKNVRRNIRDFDQLFYQFGGYISHIPLIGPAVGALHKYVYGFIKSYLIDYFMAFDPEIEAVSKVSDKYFGSRKAKPKEEPSVPKPEHQPV